MGQGKRKRKQEPTDGKSHHQDQKKSKLNSSSDASSSSDGSSSDASSSDASSSQQKSNERKNPNENSGRMSDSASTIKEKTKLKQGVVTQIIPNLDHDELTIKEVQIIGRPENVFPKSAGDHTTAFTVEEKGIAQQLKGKDITGAFNVIQNFYDAAKKLPGFKLQGNLTEDDNLKHKKRLEEAEETLKNLLENNKTLSALQQAVGAYLEFRELIPLSTVDVSVINQGERGKGHGEASKVKILVDYQQGKRQSKEALKQAIVGLFDSQSVARAILEVDKDRQSRIVPGLNDKASLQQDSIPDDKELTKKEINGIRDRRIEQLKLHMHQIIMQHLSSIDMAFPKVLNVKNIGYVKAELENVLKFQMKKQLNKSADKLTETIKAREKESQKQIEDKTIEYLDKRIKEKSFKSSLKEIEDQYNPEIQESKNKKDLINVLLENKFFEFFDNDVTSDTEMEEDTDDTEMEEDTDDTEMEEDTDDTEMEEDQKAKEPLTMQISVDSKGKITAIKSKGRTPSPFPSTMGAHTTAWIVQIDRIRKALEGKTLEEAIETVKEMKEQANKLNETRKKLFKDKKGDDEIWPFQGDDEIWPFHSERLQKAEQKLKEFTDSLELKDDKNEDFKLLKLQEYLVKLLTYINYIPGTTLYRDAKARGEGIHRQNLLEFEDGVPKTKQELYDAIEGLLDLPKDWGSDDKKPFKEQHNEIIKVTYPEAYEAVFEGKHKERIKPPQEEKEEKDKKTGKKKQRSGSRGGK